MLSSPRRSPASDEMTARSAHLPSYRSIPLRPLTGAMPPWPLVLGSDAVTVRPFATNGEFLCSVKAVTAMTVTIAGDPLDAARRPEFLRLLSALGLCLLYHGRYLPSTSAARRVSAGRSVSDALQRVWRRVDPDDRGSRRYGACPWLRAPHLHLLRLPRHEASVGLHQTWARGRERTHAHGGGAPRGSCALRARGECRDTGAPGPRGSEATRALSPRWARAHVPSTIDLTHEAARARGHPAASSQGAYCANEPAIGCIQRFQ
jgi:hypothetical protein